MADSPKWGFTFGTAREILDPAAEVERLAKAREAGALVAIPRDDLVVLVVLAHAGIAADSGAPIDVAAELPDGVTVDDAVAVFGRYIGE